MLVLMLGSVLVWVQLVGADISCPVLSLLVWSLPISLSFRFRLSSSCSFPLRLLSLFLSSSSVSPWTGVVVVVAVALAAEDAVAAVAVALAVVVGAVVAVEEAVAGEVVVTIVAAVASMLVWSSSSLSLWHCLAPGLLPSLGLFLARLLALVVWGSMSGLFWLFRSLFSKYSLVS